jgi:hypothetical protein
MRILRSCHVHVWNSQKGCEKTDQSRFPEGKIIDPDKYEGNREARA